MTPEDNVQVVNGPIIVKKKVVTVLNSESESNKNKYVHNLNSVCSDHDIALYTEAGE